MTATSESSLVILRAIRTPSDNTETNASRPASHAPFDHARSWKQAQLSARFFLIARLITASEKSGPRHDRVGRWRPSRRALELNAISSIFRATKFTVTRPRTSSAFLGARGQPEHLPRELESFFLLGLGLGLVAGHHRRRRMLRLLLPFVPARSILVAIRR